MSNSTVAQMIPSWDSGDYRVVALLGCSQAVQTTQPPKMGQSLKEVAESVLIHLRSGIFMSGFEYGLAVRKVPKADTGVTENLASAMVPKAAIQNTY